MTIIHESIFFANKHTSSRFPFPERLFSPIESSLNTVSLAQFAN
jgi:hypothetical protein